MKEQEHFKINMDNPFTHYKWAKALAKPDSSEFKFLIDQSPKSFRARPKSEFITLTVLEVDLDPRRHKSVDLSARKESLTLRNLMTSSYLSPCFTLIFSARALWKIEHSWPITPVVVNTNGVKVPCTTSMTLRFSLLLS